VPVPTCPEFGTPTAARAPSCFDVREQLVLPANRQINNLCLFLSSLLSTYIVCLLKYAKQNSLANKKKMIIVANANAKAFHYYLAFLNHFTYNES